MKTLTKTRFWKDIFRDEFGEQAEKDMKRMLRGMTTESQEKPMIDVDSSYYSKTYSPAVKVRQPMLPAEVQTHKYDFNELIDYITGCTPKAQATFLYLLVDKLRPNLLVTFRRYIHNKLTGNGYSSKQRQRKYNAETDEFEEAR